MKRSAGVILLAAGLVMIIIGIAEGQPETVFSKAVTICLECVGIG